jgi:hypothetical protein
MINRMPQGKFARCHATALGGFASGAVVGGWAIATVATNHTIDISTPW